MDEENPLVKDTAVKTLNEVVNSLLYVVETMLALGQSIKQPEGQNPDEGDLLITMERSKYSGLKSIIDVARAAAESGYSQHAHELSAKDRLIEQLQQTAAKAEVKD